MLQVYAGSVKDLISQNINDSNFCKTGQRHDRDQTENQQNAATVDSCFELVGSRMHGVAQQKVEHQRESSVLPNVRGNRFRMGPNSDICPRHGA